MEKDEKRWYDRWSIDWLDSKQRKKVWVAMDEGGWEGREGGRKEGEGEKKWEKYNTSHTTQEYVIKRPIHKVNTQHTGYTIVISIYKTRNNIYSVYEASLLFPHLFSLLFLCHSPLHIVCRVWFVFVFVDTLLSSPLTYFSYYYSTISSFTLLKNRHHHHRLFFSLPTLTLSLFSLVSI